MYDKGEAGDLRDARSSLRSASLEWHRFDLDIITRRLQEMYNALKRLSTEGDGKSLNKAGDESSVPSTDRNEFPVTDSNQ